MRKIPSSEITPEHIYLSRRRFLKGATAWAAGILALGACARPTDDVGPVVVPPADVKLPEALRKVTSVVVPGRTDELGNPVTTLDRVSTYGNYYEFTRNRMQVAQATANFVPVPAHIEVGGLVRNPRVYDLDALRRFGEEERIYRLRCIECWAMVVPWAGFPLHRLLAEVEPTSDARYIRFESVYDPEHMPGQRIGTHEGVPITPETTGMGAGAVAPYTWPYVEALRIEEAMHDLTLLAIGMYGRALTMVNGAPVRLVVPWKYAFKSIKAITRIDLVAERPATFWNTAIPSEYGFNGNVNPEVPHPRWAQDKEARYRGVCPERIVDSLMFNGYADEVASLYEGVDLREDF
jgi:methionine sulfoxide reductase catalytic subunit